MTGSKTHHLRRSGTCLTQGLRRCAVMRPVVARREDKAMQHVFAGTAGTGRPVVARREDKAMQHVFAGTAGTGRPIVVFVWNQQTGPGLQN